MHWTPNTVIRHKQNGKPMLVVHVYRNCVIVVDIEDGNDPTQVRALLARDWTNWGIDHDFDRREKCGNNVFKYNHIKIV